MNSRYDPGWDNSSAARGAVIADAGAAHYPSSNYSSEFQRVAAVLRDVIFACPTRRLARALDSHDSPVWRYRFAPHYCTAPGLITPGLMWPDIQLLHCYHTSELYSVFGHAWPDLPFRSLDESMQKVRQSVQSYWGAFARSADPNSGGDAPSWPRWSAKGGEQTMHLSEAPAPQTGYLEADCDFWDKLCGDDCFGPGP
jgi:para-nitrobenzyl esterase